MKILTSKFLLVLCFILFSFAGYSQDFRFNSLYLTAQPGNYVNGPAKVGGTLDLTFNFSTPGNWTFNGTGGSKDMTIVISLSYLDAGTPFIVPTGAGADLFTWTYDETIRTYTGTSKAGSMTAMTVYPIKFSGLQVNTFRDGTQTDIGANANLQPPAAIVGNSTTNDNIKKFTFTDGTLPVKFGAISAKVENNTLNVNWATEFENNNSRFVVEVAKDSSFNFVAVDSVNTQAKDGNSTEQLTYSYSKALTALTMLGMGANIPALLAVLTVLGLVAYVSRRYSKTKGISLGMSVIVAVALVSMFVASCRRDDKQLLVAKQKDVYIRITQVDIDGTRVSSKIIKAINE